MKYKLVLASGSPRRKDLLEKMGFEFSIRTLEVDEHFPQDLKAEQVAEYLSKKKSDAYIDSLKQGELIITADTIVVLNGEVLNKPTSEQQAIKMLQNLSGKQHEVITGVTLLTRNSQMTFHVVSSVQFNELSEADIIKYVATGQSMDKAGAYGIQDWIGTIGVVKIEGSYENIMGLPSQELYKRLQSF